jgi:hypothetical protein
MRSRRFKTEVEPGLKDFFSTVVLPLSGPRPTRWTRQESGAVDEADFEDVSELDPEWTKRRLFGRYCFDLGHHVTKASSMQVTKRTDQDWLESGAVYGHICSWGFFWGYWRRHHSKIIVRKPSRDICGLCYQFHLGHRTGSRTRNNLDIDDDASIESEDDNDVDEDGALMQARELETQRVVKEIKQHIEDAISMRALCQILMEAAKTATKLKYADDEMVITLVADYCQNMEMPFFGKDQPGDTYYYTPKTINLFGIVDCNSEKDILYAYAYGEDHGGKGGNNVASLLMKHLEDRGFLDGRKRKTLNIVMDNCAGQNKNNYVLRLAAYLVEKRYFEEVHFVFLVVGHTKNVADRLFNILKKLYRAQNIFTSGMMLKSMSHEHTIPQEVDWQVFKNWDKYLNRIYKAKMSSVKKWQMFSSTTARGLTKMSFKSSNVEGATTEEEDIKKRGVDGEKRNQILLEPPTPLYAVIPGLREIKQVELWSKYRPLVPKEYRDECCPMPCKEVIEREKNKKKEKGKLKRDEKKKKGKLEVAPLAAATESSDKELISPSSPSKRSRQSAELE